MTRVAGPKGTAELEPPLIWMWWASALRITTGTSAVLGWPGGGAGFLPRACREGAGSAGPGRVDVRRPDQGPAGGRIAEISLTLGRRLRSVSTSCGWTRCPGCRARSEPAMPGRAGLGDQRGHASWRSTPCCPAVDRSNGMNRCPSASAGMPGPVSAGRAAHRHDHQLWVQDQMEGWRRLEQGTEVQPIPSTRAPTGSATSRFPALEALARPTKERSQMITSAGTRAS